MKTKFSRFMLLLFFSFGVLVIPVTTWGEESAKASLSAKTDTKVEQNTQDETSEKRKKIVEEASSAITETQNALKALDRKKTSDALAALERATGKLNIILAREPKLALAPMGVQAATYDILGGIDEVKSLREKAADLVRDGRIQEARHIFRNLASETVISVTNIPLATYPLAINKAVKLIDEKKEEDAKRVLQSALNTLVITDTIIPLPVARAEELLKEAEKLSETKDRKDEDNKRLSQTLKEVKVNLEYAQALGYGTKQDFKDLYEQLVKIEEDTKGGKSGFGFFDKIKSSIQGLFASSQAGEQAEKQSTSNNQGD